MKKKSPVTVKKSRDDYSKVYQIKITLKNSKPPIWRRIQVPENYTFWDLHCAITDSMGWLDYHLHEFAVRDPETGEDVLIGIPGDDEEMTLGWNLKIKTHFTAEGTEIPYTYDIGDNWEHAVVLENVLPRETGMKYPRCIDGKRACPPEDCGGIWGYYEMLAIVSDRKHKEYVETVTWLGKTFDPEKFNITDVKFSDPARRMKKLV